MENPLHMKISKRKKSSEENEPEKMSSSSGLFRCEGKALDRISPDISLKQACPRSSLGKSKSQAVSINSQKLSFSRKDAMNAVPLSLVTILPSSSIIGSVGINIATSSLNSLTSSRKVGTLPLSPRGSPSKNSNAGSSSQLVDFSSNLPSNSTVKPDYMLHSKSKKGSKDLVPKGLALDKGLDGHAG
jgi:hypothetical protein